jgi:hypothetical protein
MLEGIRTPTIDRHLLLSHCHHLVPPGQQMRRLVASKVAPQERVLPTLCVQIEACPQALNAWAWPPDMACWKKGEPATWSRKQ